MKKSVLYKQFNKLIEYKLGGLTYIDGIYKNNIKWHEKIEHTGYHSTFLNLYDLKNNTDIKYLNDWLSYCNKNRMDEVSIYINRPNINSLLNHLQNTKYTSESLYLRHIPINYIDDMIKLYNKTDKNNYNNNIKNEYKNSISRYGDRVIYPLSYIVDYDTYNINNIIKMCNYTDLNFLKSLLVYDMDYISDDKTIDLDIDKMYNIKVEHIYDIFRYLEMYDRSLRIYDRDNYTFNFYINLQHKYEYNKVSLKSKIYKLNNMFDDIGKTYKLNFYVYFPFDYMEYIDYNSEHIRFHD